MSDDEVRRKLLKPIVTEEEALSILVDLYIPDGFDISKDVELPRAQVLQALDSYDDVNYLVKIDGTKAVLKVHNGVESEQYIAAHARKFAKLEDDDRPSNKDVGSISTSSIIDLHTAVFAHLAKPQYHVTTGQTIYPIQKSYRDEADGVSVRELSVVSSAHSPQQLVIRLQSYVDGTPLCSIPWFPVETLLDAGECLGRMCHALDDLASSDPDALVASQRYHAWDGRNLLDARPYIVHIDDFDRRKLVTNVIDEFQKTIIEGKECEKFRMGINHGDLNDGNLVSLILFHLIFMFDSH
jgi:Ser/Thr protein kinase RdoA (MazF antagonist)